MHLIIHLYLRINYTLKDPACQFLHDCREINCESAAYVTLFRTLSAKTPEIKVCAVEITKVV